MTGEVPVRTEDHSSCAGLGKQPEGGFFIEGWDKKRPIDDETNRGACACGRFDVSDQYHWHHDGVCHNRTECK